MQRLIGEYAEGYRLLAEAIAGMSEEMLRFKPSPNEWSIKEIVIHAADAELVGVHRMKKILAEEHPLLLAFDQDVWTDRLQYSELDHRLYMELFRLLRDGMARILQQLKAEDFARTGVHNVAGKITLEDLLRSYIGHVQTHLRQIERVKAAYRG